MCKLALLYCYFSLESHGKCELIPEIPRSAEEYCTLHSQFYAESAKPASCSVTIFGTPFYPIIFTHFLKIPSQCHLKPGYQVRSSM